MTQPLFNDAFDLETHLPPIPDWERQPGKKGQISQKELAEQAAHQAAQAERVRVRNLFADLLGHHRDLQHEVTASRAQRERFFEDYGKLQSKLLASFPHMRVACRVVAELGYLMPDAEIATTVGYASDSTPEITMKNGYGTFVMNYTRGGGYKVCVTPDTSLKRNPITLSADAHGLEPEDVLKLIALLQLQPGDKLPERTAKALLAKPSHGQPSKNIVNLGKIRERVDSSLLSKLRAAEAGQPGVSGHDHVVFALDLSGLPGILGGRQG